MKFPSAKDYIRLQLRPSCVRIALLAVLYTVFRLVFYVVNMGGFTSCSFSVFFYGLQFDFSAIFYTNAPYILAVLLPFAWIRKKVYRKICDVYFILINGFAALVSYIDVAYYPYVLKRMTADIFSYMQIGFDFQTLLPSFLKQFWYLVLVFIVTLIAIVFIVRLTNRMIENKPISHLFSWRSFLYKTMMFLTVIFISVIFMRGGFQLRPITLIDTGKYASIQNAALIANTPFGLIHTFGKQNNIEKHYFQDMDEAERYFKPILTHISPCTEDCYPIKNVVVIVMESFSQYLIQDLDTNMVGYQGYCPFLDSLLHKSVSFNGIANGRRTIEALPAIFGGIPTLLDMSYVESSFANNYAFSPVEILKENGYNTVFFHGAKNGSMNIESYCRSIGFKTYYGKNEYPTPSDYDGIWGISDRPYLKYVAHTLNTISRPFFAGVLTLSSHNPFILPKDAQGLDIKTGTHPMHAVASYTDHALREFFETMSQYSWYDNTLFIFTGDHTGEGTIPVPDNRYMSYQIPIFFYHPLANTAKTKHLIQQLDIMPSVFSYLRIDTPLFSFGNNVFDTAYPPCAVNYLSGIYQLFTDDYILQFDGEKTIGLYNIKEDIYMQNNLTDTMPDKVDLYEQKLKAIIQSYTTRMNRNRLFIEL
jgi:phosphoglycerol transferase MdoB-like AlkP superfamily enzyme